MACMKYKSKMKAVYEAAGVKACRYHLVHDYEGCVNFLNEVGDIHRNQIYKRSPALCPSIRI